LLFVFTRVGTYVQHGSKFCFVVLLLLGVTVIAQNIALLSNFTMHSAALPRQPCSAVRPISTGFDALARSAVTALYYSGRSPNLFFSNFTMLSLCVTKLHERAAALTGLNLFLVQFHYLHAHTADQQTGSNLFSCSYVELLHHNF
jgi:hypothetical protein